jgi:hypothetical protein
MQIRWRCPLTRRTGQDITRQKRVEYKPREMATEDLDDQETNENSDTE